MFCLSAQQFRRASRSFILFRRQRFGTLRPDRGIRLDRRRITQAERGEFVAKAGVVAVGGIGYHHTRRHARLPGLADLVESHGGFGLKDDLVRDACLTAPFRVLRPVLRQVQTIGNG